MQLKTIASFYTTPADRLLTQLSTKTQAVLTIDISGTDKVPTKVTKATQKSLPKEVVTLLEAPDTEKTAGNAIGK